MTQPDRENMIYESHQHSHANTKNATSVPTRRRKCYLCSHTKIMLYMFPHKVGMAELLLTWINFCKLSSISLDGTKEVLFHFSRARIELLPSSDPWYLSRTVRLARVKIAHYVEATWTSKKKSVQTSGMCRSATTSFCQAHYSDQMTN
jgi:hypothetical protein